MDTQKFGNPICEPMTVQAGGITLIIIMQASLKVISAQHPLTICLGCCSECCCFGRPSLICPVLV